MADAVPETTEAYEDLRGMIPGAPVGMLESGTPGEPEGYELVMTRSSEGVELSFSFVLPLFLLCISFKDRIIGNLSSYVLLRSRPVSRYSSQYVDDRTRVGRVCRAVIFAWQRKC